MNRADVKLIIIAVVAAIVAFVLALAFFGCASVPLMPGALPAAGLARVYDVAPGILRSPQPNRKQFAALVASYGIGCVIKLNGVLEGEDEPPRGVDVYRHEWWPAGPVSHEDIEEALSDLEACRAAGRFVLVHCSHGVDRTGMMVALYRVRHGTSPEQAYREWVAYGRDLHLTLFTDTFARETGWQP